MSDIASRGYANPNVLVSTEWVAAHLQDPQVRIIESNEDQLLYYSSEQGQTLYHIFKFCSTHGWVF